MSRVASNRNRSAHHWRATLQRAFSPRTWLLRHSQVALESLGRLTRTPLASLMTAAVIGIALALPAALFVLFDNLDQLSGSWNGQATLSVFLKDTLPAQAASDLAATLRGWPEVATVTLITPDEALEEFGERSGFGDVLAALEENPLPAVLLVRPAAGHSGPQAAAALQARLQELPETDLAQLDLEWVQRLHAMLGLARRGVLLISALLALAVLLVIGNTIRLEIQNRREEIVVSKLIGATDGFVRRPFLYSGLWYGVSGALLAWLLVQGGLLLLAGPVQELAELYRSGFSLHGLPLLMLLLLLAGGMLLGLLGSWLAVGRHLGAIEPT